MSLAFNFVGTVPSSKSLFNRALIVQSFYPQFEIIGESLGDDVRLMKAAVHSLEKREAIDCGMAGTVLRFMALRVAREKGEFVLQGHPRLFERPQKELLKLLGQLGVDAKLGVDSLSIRSQGWRGHGDALHVSGEQSSQFASALLLSAWGLEQPLHLSLSQKIVSQKYFLMTCELLQELGMNIVGQGNEWTVAKNQKLSVPSLSVETDMSSAFAVAALAAVGGEARLLNFTWPSLQPDREFVNVLQSMGVPVAMEGENFVVHQTQGFRGIDKYLADTPDLFPVLSVLCALADGQSRLYGAAHLSLKESNRLDKTAELLKLLGAKFAMSSDGVTIFGPTDFSLVPPVEFDPDSDHRMVMAANLAAYAGAQLQIRNPQVVCKSYPEYLNLIPSEVRSIDQ